MSSTVSVDCFSSSNIWSGFVCSIEVTAYSNGLPFKFDSMANMQTIANHNHNLPLMSTPSGTKDWSRRKNLDASLLAHNFRNGSTIPRALERTSANGRSPGQARLTPPPYTHTQMHAFPLRKTGALFSHCRLTLSHCVH